MAIEVMQRPHVEAVREAVSEVLGISAAPAEDPTRFLILPHYEDTVAFKRFLARGSGALGVEVATLSRWIRDQWGLWGDGRRLVTTQLRRALIALILIEHPGLSATPGVVALVEELVRGYLPYLQDTPLLNPAEQAVIYCTQVYREQIEKMGLCEESQVAKLLPHAIETKAPIVVAGFYLDELSYHHRLLFEELDVTLVENALTLPTPQQREKELTELQSRLFSPDPLDPLQPQGTLSFCFAAGPSAQAQLITNKLVEALAQYPKGIISVVSRDPSSMFNRVAYRLKKQGIDSSCRITKHLVDTDAGRATVQLLELLSFDTEDTLHTSTANTFLATDLAFNPLLGIKRSQAFLRDAQWRSNRLATTSGIIADLSHDLPKALQGFLESLVDKRVTEAVGLLTNWVSSRQDWEECYRIEQLSALNELCLLAEAFETTSCPISLLAPMIEQVTISFPLSTGSAQVEFCTLEEGSQKEPGSCSVLFLCDATTEAYPLKARTDALSELLEKLGLGSEQDVTREIQRKLYRVLETPCNLVCIERTLSNTEAEPTYPSYAYEEIVDCYRGSLTDADNLDKVFALPKSLCPVKPSLGEEETILNLAGVSEQTIVETYQSPELGILSDQNTRQVLLPRGRSAGQQGGFRVSPSTIEAYLSCPYRWFIERRIGREAPDEVPGGMGRGSFVHEALRVFYESLIQAGHRRVTQENLDVAQEGFARVFDALTSAQDQLSPCEGRYLLLTASERKEHALLRTQLLEQIERESRLFYGFEPRYLEWQYGYEKPFSFADCLIEGKIDRIDINPEDNTAIIIDYKTGSLDGYEMEMVKDAESFLPRMVQAYIYAGAVQDLLGLTIAAVLYLNPIKGKISGAYDSSRIGLESLSGLLKPTKSVLSSRGVRDFPDLLGRIEQEIKPYLDGLKSCNIAPEPRYREVCDYCPVQHCEKRQGTGRWN